MEHAPTGHNEYIFTWASKGDHLHGAFTSFYRTSSPTRMRENHQVNFRSNNSEERQNKGLKRRGGMSEINVFSK